MKNTILFFLLIFTVSVNAQLDQFRMVGSASWTVDSPTDYSATVTFQSDLTANGFLPTGITTSMQVFTQTGQVYTISSATNLTFSTADLVIVESGGDWGTPVGQVMVYDPEGRSAVPNIPFGATGATAKLQEAVDSYNSRFIGSGSSGSSGHYAFQSTAPDTSLLWIDATTWDGTTVYQVRDYVSGVWSVIGWHDVLGDVFSSSPPQYLVFTGQSNSQARGNFEVGVNVEADTVESIYSSIFNPLTDVWELLDVKKAFLTATQVEGTEPKVWWGTTIGQEGEKDGIITKFIFHGIGGKTINGWTENDNLDGTTTVSSEHWDSLSAAITRSNIPRIDAVVWYQGETDGAIGRTPKSYEADWLSVYGRFQSLSQWQEYTKIIACQISAGGTQEMANEFFASLAIDSDANTYVAENDYEVEADSSHIKGGGHVILGRRLWQIITGGNIFNPIPQYRLGQTSGLTASLDFHNSTIQVNAFSPVVITDYKNVVDGWSGNLRFVGNSGVTARPDLMFCESITGNTVQIDTFRAPFFTHASIVSDSLFCTSCPPNLKIGLPTPLETGAYAWYDVSNTTLADGATLSTLEDLSGNNYDLTGFNSPTIRKNEINGLSAVELRSNAYFRETTTVFSFLHDNPSTIFAVVNIRDSIQSNATLIGNHGNTSSHLGYGWVIVNTDSLDESVNMIHYIGRGGGGIVVSGSYPSIADERYSMLWVKSDPENVTANQRSFFRENGEAVDNTNAQTAAVSGTLETFFSIGRNLFDTYADFSFSEIIIYDSVLSAAQTTEVENYISAKYNIVIN